MVTSLETRLQMTGGSLLVINWLTLQWKVNHEWYKEVVHRFQNELDGSLILPRSDGADVFHHVYREWNEEADKLTIRAPASLAWDWAGIDRTT